MKRAEARAQRLRPMPPAGLGQHSFPDGTFPPRFMAATEVQEWVREFILTPGAALHNPDHKHLAEADWAICWAGCRAYRDQGTRRILGTAEKLQFQPHKWTSCRAEDAMLGIFGRAPEFLVTLCAEYCATCSDVEFCALLEHELYHIGHVGAAVGEPEFDREGKPKIALRGHDVEEFVGVVSRYGVGRADGALARLAAAARDKPTVSALNVSAACGLCMMRAA